MGQKLSNLFKHKQTNTQVVTTPRSLIKIPNDVLCLMFSDYLAHYLTPKELLPLRLVNTIFHDIMDQLHFRHPTTATQDPDFSICALITLKYFCQCPQDGLIRLLPKLTSSYETLSLQVSHFLDANDDFYVHYQALQAATDDIRTQYYQNLVRQKKIFKEEKKKLKTLLAEEKLGACFRLRKYTSALGYGKAATLSTSILLTLIISGYSCTIDPTLCALLFLLSGSFLLMVAYSCLPTICSRHFQCTLNGIEAESAQNVKNYTYSLEWLREKHKRMLEIHHTWTLPNQLNKFFRQQASTSISMQDLHPAQHARHEPVI